ncbi:MAG: M20/M25/M40 family metallo-hydrolase [Kiritimatiellae bacterium]|nr:M20/M25/M40 family metallo-hydrolase [Kiritimatiellia bacterium]
MNGLLANVKLKRVADDLWRLVCVPSPTGGERRAALTYARMLAAAGARVELDETIYESPAVIGRLAGKRPGRTFQLAGHIDHIDAPHAPPVRKGNIICGRGAADMKSGLAGILEVIRVLNESSRDFAGQVLVTVYGLHEAPKGTSAPIMNLIRRKITGDAAMVAESTAHAENRVVIMGKGQAIWTITAERHGQTCHEMNAPRDGDALCRFGLKLADQLLQYNRNLQTRKHAFPLLGPESMFIGQIHYGDFYNRLPQKMVLQGTRRWHPVQSFKDIRREMQKLMDGISLPKGVTAHCDWSLTGEPYCIGPDEPVVRAYRRARRTVLGRAGALAGIAVVVDAHRLVSLGHVPTVLQGFDNRSAHADCEYVQIARLRQPCRIMLLTILNYLNTAGEKHRKSYEANQTSRRGYRGS